MPLLPPPPSATAPAPEDVNRATALLSALRAKNLAMRRVVVSKWADEFRLLRQAYKPQQIDATLNWYCSHVAGEWVPQAFSAAGFRAKFDEITAAATRGRKYDALPDPSPLAKKIAAEAELWGGWPGDSASQLPAAAQLCHDGVKSVRAKLRNYVVVHDGADDNRREDEKRIALAKEMLARLPDHTEYPREFLRRLHKRVTNWPGFDGNVLSPNLRFDPDGKDFQALCRAKCNDYCHEPERWDALWAEVNK